ncbi:MAG TPA: hypothetical protein VK445_12580 [Dissulfurispiraceae bacterium]|nr:hypothetical protein [Dissulfurispiraceae bacterium]
MSSEQQLCILCAWRGTCQKQFSMKPGLRCPDYAKDLTIKEKPAPEAAKDK